MRSNYHRQGIRIDTNRTGSTIAVGSTHDQYNAEGNQSIHLELHTQELSFKTSNNNSNF